MATPMSTPIQNLPTATVTVSKEDDSTLRDVLKEVELEISAPQPPKAPRIPPNTPVQPQANNTPLIYAMPTPLPVTSSQPVFKVGPLTINQVLLKYAIIASVVAAVINAPITLQKLYQTLPILSKFQTYEWIIKVLVMIVIIYLVFLYWK